jgi:hypothetical protein
MYHHGTWPRQDWLSFTEAGTPWIDFEWLSQLIFGAAWKTGGFTGLWLLKAFLMLAIWALLDALLKLHQIPGRGRAAGLVLWSTGAMAYSDIRPDLFSLLALAALILGLESLRLGRLRVKLKTASAILILFALWANLHSGFVLGLVVLAIYAASLNGGAKLILPAVLGTVINPYGPSLYPVIWAHMQRSSELALYIKEWHPMGWSNPLFWPFWPQAALLGFCLAERLWRGRRRDLPWALAACALVLGAGARAHERAYAYFNLAGTAAICVLAWQAREKSARRAVAAACAACAIFVFWLTPRLYKRGVFHAVFVPVPAAEFLDRERAAIEPLRTYNPWEWGGYLGWRLSPWYKVFCDGRYIFHDLLPLEAQSTTGDQRWQKFLADENLDAALLQNFDWTVPTVRQYPDGGTKAFRRPWYLSYMPRQRWAFVYWDDQALFFVRRDAVPKEWLVAHEYRYARPGDEAAYAEALSRGEIPKAAAAAEQARHQADLALSRAP